MTEARWVAMTVALAYSLLTIYAVNTRLPGPVDLVTAVAVIFLVVSGGLWLLDDETINDYQYSKWQSSWMVFNLAGQVAVMILAGWWFTAFLRIATLVNEECRQEMAWRRTGFGSPAKNRMLKARHKLINLMDWIEKKFDEGPTYLIEDDGKSIVCKRCGLKSWHPKDVEKLYCGHCHKPHIC